MELFFTKVAKCKFQIPNKVQNHYNCPFNQKTAETKDLANE
jgi:hypothetical protein